MISIQGLNLTLFVFVFVSLLLENEANNTATLIEESLFPREDLDGDGNSEVEGSGENLMVFALQRDSIQPEVVQAVGTDDSISAQVRPGPFDDARKLPVGERFGLRYRVSGAGEDDWSEPIWANDSSLMVNVSGLEPDTPYDLEAVAQTRDDDGNVIVQSYSPIYTHRTKGDPVCPSRCFPPPAFAPMKSDEPITAAWIIAIIVIVIILIIILIICCLLIRNKGAKYPVQEKEKAQGREPMLPAEKGFGEYSKPVDEEKLSLTGEAVPGSETDSMAEYGDGDPGKFTEDGSFIGQYAAPSKFPQIPAEARRPTDSQTSPLTTFMA